MQTSPAEFDDRIMATLAGAGSLLAELRMIMDHHPEQATHQEICDWIVGQNILVKRTQAGRTKALSKLKRRYILDSDRHIFAGFCAAWRQSAESQQQGLLAYLLHGSQDGFLRLAATTWLGPYLSIEGQVLETADVERHIARMAEEDAQIAAWSAKTKLRVAQHLLTAIRDFGLARGRVKKVSVRPTIGPVVAWYAARLAMLQGLSPRDALTSDWFAMLGLELSGAVDALYRMAGKDLGRFRVEGQIVELVLNDLTDRDISDGP